MTDAQAKVIALTTLNLYWHPVVVYTADLNALRDQLRIQLATIEHAQKFDKKIIKEYYSKLIIAS